MITIDLERGIVTAQEGDSVGSYALATPEAFALVSRAWLRCGWDNKYVYGFTWMGRPIIQLPDDLIRIQEVIYDVKPDVLIETGIAHGGSLFFYASLFKAMGRGRVIGIDIDIRAHNRKAIEEHQLFEYITLVEGSSIAPDIVQRVGSMLSQRETVLVVLDSNHSKAHVLAELEAYSKFVSIGSYLVATDGIMADLVGAPRSSADWGWNNPKTAAEEFVRDNPKFALHEPAFPFNEGNVTERVTYWPSAYVKRIAP